MNVHGYIHCIIIIIILYSLIEPVVEVIGQGK